MICPLTGYGCQNVADASFARLPWRSGRLHRRRIVRVDRTVGAGAQREGLASVCSARPCRDCHARQHRWRGGHGEARKLLLLLPTDHHSLAGSIVVNLGSPELKSYGRFGAPDLRNNRPGG